MTKIQLSATVVLALALGLAFSYWQYPLINAPIVLVFIFSAALASLIVFVVSSLLGGASQNGK